MEYVLLGGKVLLFIVALVLTVCFVACMEMGYFGNRYDESRAQREAQHEAPLFFLASLTVWTGFIMWNWG